MSAHRVVTFVKRATIAYRRKSDPASLRIQVGSSPFPGYLARHHECSGSMVSNMQLSLFIVKEKKFRQRFIFFACQRGIHGSLTNTKVLTDWPPPHRGTGEWEMPSLCLSYMQVKLRFPDRLSQGFLLTTVTLQYSCFTSHFLHFYLVTPSNDAAKSEYG